MPLLMILLLTTACMPMAWPEVWPSTTHWPWLIPLALVIVSLMITTLFSQWIYFQLQSKDTRSREVIALYYRGRHWLFYANLFIAIAAILLGWGAWITIQMKIPQANDMILAPFAELLVPAPYFVLIISSWCIYYPTERQLHERMNIFGQESFWTLPGYLLYQARQFCLLILLPVVLFVSQQSFTRSFPEFSSTGIYQCLSIVGLLILFIIMPLLVKPLLGLKVMPGDGTQQRLSQIAQELDFRLTSLLLWPTKGAVANAMVIGMVPQARYVIFTDRILELLEPTELDAVFGHEAGHAVHGHLPYYMLFLLMSMFAGVGLLGVFQYTPWGDSIAWLWESRTAVVLLPTVCLGLYLFLVFGFLSRVCERQADLFGCRVGSCGNPQCQGHDTDAAASQLTAKQPCPTSTRAMIHALERVMVSHRHDESDHRKTAWLQKFWHWVRDWQHGPPSQRIEFLYRTIDQPALVAKHHRYAFAVRCTLILLLLSIIIGSVSGIGWSTFFQLLRMI